MSTELNLSKPERKRRISLLEVLHGSPIDPIDRIRIMSDTDYEVFTLEWVFGSIANKYIKVRSYSGAGDKGRDVVGLYANDEIDVYQCKHYQTKIGPGTFFTELGKLCHYTFTNVYRIPKNYFIVSPQGCGPTVLDLITNPKKINEQLAAGWTQYCRTKITSKEPIELEGDFEEYVRNFDFSIVKDIAPHEVIAQHRNTEYFSSRFGGGIKKFREVIPAAETEIQAREQKYTAQLFEVYSEKLGCGVTCAEELADKDGELARHFNQQRNSFYSCESLEKFSRENFMEAENEPFEDLKTDAENALFSTLMRTRTEPGFERVLIASQEIQRQNFENSPLHFEIKPLDKDGLCHHLANEERIKWIQNEHRGKE